MENNKEKTPDRKPAGFILEWISDNLRYILLFGGMALIVVIVVAVASVILDGSGLNQNGSSVTAVQSEDTSEDTEEASDSIETSSASEETEETSEESVEADETSEESVETEEVEETSESSSDTSDEGSQEQQSSDEGTSSGQSSGESTSSGQSSGENASSGQTSNEDVSSGQSSSGSTDSSGGSDAAQQTSALSEASEAITSTVTSYFNALASADADAAAAVMESLSDDYRQVISSGLSMGGYHNIVVYTYPGESDNEWVAFARYYYTYSEFTTAVPALTQFYLITGQDGSVLIASETTLEAKMDYMSSILSLDDVSALISEVQAEYDAVLAANPALAAYIESMS